MMKRIIYILSLVFLALSVDAQQFPLQSQYHLNYSTINPAAVGESQNYIVKASLRQQWVGFSDNAIGTNILTLNKGFGNNGLGFNIFENSANVEILDKETGISPGQACVFYSKDKIGDKVLGGGWIHKTLNKNLSTKLTS